MPDTAVPMAELDVHDLVTELTRTHSHRERYLTRRGTTTITSGHVTSVPALVMQLLEAAPAGSGENSGGGSAKSRPALRIEAVDTLMLIDDEAERWILRLGGQPTKDRLDPHTMRPIPGSGTITAIQRVHGLYPSSPTCGRDHGHRVPTGPAGWCCQRHRLEHDLRRWWRQARILSGWDSPAWRPDNSCPVCEVRRSLRINLTTQEAVCVDCRTVWSSTDIGLLAEHIRFENGDVNGEAS